MSCSVTVESKYKGKETENVVIVEHCPLLSNKSNIRGQQASAVKVVTDVNKELVDLLEVEEEKNAFRT